VYLCDLRGKEFNHRGHREEEKESQQRARRGPSTLAARSSPADSDSEQKVLDEGLKDFGEKFGPTNKLLSLIHTAVAIAILIIANLTQSLDHLLDQPIRRRSSGGHADATASA